MHGTVASGKASSSESSLDTKSSSQIQLPSGPLPLPHPTPTPPATPHLSRALVNGLTIKENTTAGRDEEEFMPLVDAVPLVHLSVRPAAFASTQELGDHLTRLNLASEHRVRPRCALFF